MIARLLDWLMSDRIRAVLFLGWVCISTVIFLASGLHLFFRSDFGKTVMGIILFSYGVVPVAIWWDIRQNRG